MIQVLAGKNILICRPAAAASELEKILTSVGAKCHVFPTIEIDKLELSSADKQYILDLDQYDDVIVVSQHAARFGLQLIDEYWPQLPVKQRWYAIGRKTAEALSSEGIDPVTPAGDLSSEELLDLPTLKDVKNRKILILKGIGGREAIESTLKSRSARVDTLELYKRTRPNYTVEEIRSALTTFEPAYIIALSGETLINLLELSESANINITNNKFILPSQRVAHQGLESGVRNSFVPENLKPIDIIQCIARADRQTRTS